MKKLERVKILFLLVFGFIFMGFSADKVNAEEVFSIKVYSKESESWVNIVKSSDIPGISYDKASKTVTLNGYNGGAMSVRYYPDSNSDTEDLNIDLKFKIIGNNTINDFTRDSLISTEGYVNYSFVGTGTLNMLITNNTHGCIDATSYSDVTSIVIDGPTFNVDMKNEYFIRGAKSIVVKKGTINAIGEVGIKEDSSESEGTYYWYQAYAALSAENISVIDGKINIEYKVSDLYEEGMKLKQNGTEVYVIDSEETPFVVNDSNRKKIKIIIPEKFKEYLYPYRQTGLGVSILYKEDTIYSKYYTSLSPKGKGSIDEVKGLSWDEETYTLTMNGYHGNDIGLYGINYKNHIKIRIVGNNTITCIDDVDYNFWGASAMFLYRGDYEIVGDGTLNIYDKTGFGDGIYVNPGVSLTINGPQINTHCSNGYGLHVADFTMKSGSLKIYKDLTKLAENTDYVYVREAIIIKGNEFKVLGGTIAIIYDGQFYKDKNYTVNSAIFAVDANNVSSDKIDAYIDNCLIAIVGPDEIIESRSMINCDNNGKIFGANAHILYADSLNNLTKVDISRFKATLLQKECTYDGKAKCPEVKVGGLVKNVDYSVSYSDNVKVGTGLVKIIGKGLYTGTVTLKFTIKENKNIKKTYGPKKGKVLKDKVFKYKVVKSASKDGAIIGKLSVIGLRKKNRKNATLKSEVEIKGLKYKVTSIGKNAFAKSKKLKKITLCEGLKKIGKKAFSRKGKKALEIIVPKKSYKKYKKLLKKAKCINYVIKK